MKTIAITNQKGGDCFLANLNSLVMSKKESNIFANIVIKKGIFYEECYRWKMPDFKA